MTKLPYPLKADTSVQLFSPQQAIRDVIDVPEKKQKTSSLGRVGIRTLLSELSISFREISVETSTQDY